jgi:hypothetical protein
MSPGEFASGFVVTWPGRDASGRKAQWQQPQEEARNTPVALPADQVPVCEGKAPDGRGTCLFYVKRSVLDTIRDDGPPWKLDEARFIEEAVKEPDAIFEGLNRPGMADAVAYSVRPMRDPEEEEGPPTLPRYGQAFVVYARPGTWGYVILDWEWRAEDGEQPGHPTGWEADFVRRTWNKT